MKSAFKTLYREIQVKKRPARLSFSVPLNDHDREEFFSRGASTGFTR